MFHLILSKLLNFFFLHQVKLITVWWQEKENRPLDTVCKNESLVAKVKSRINVKGVFNRL